MELDPRSSMHHWIAIELRKQRSVRGLTQTSVGELLDRKKAWVSNLESGRPEWHLSPAHALILDREWDTGDLFSLLVFWAAQGKESDWFRDFRTHEAGSAEIRTYEALVVPGLLQVEEYTRSLFYGSGVDDIAAQIDGRRKRQALLEKVSPPQVWAVIPETVLDTPVGGRGVMREQLAALLVASEQPNIVIRVLPRETGAHVGLSGSFTVMGGGTAGDAVYMDACGVGRLVYYPPEVHRYRIRFERIGADALTRVGSRQLISAKIKEYGNG